MPQQTLPFFLKTCFSLLLLLSAAMASGADIAVSRARLNGRTQRIMPLSWCEFDCLVENKDSVPHEISVRLRSKDNDPLTNNCSGSIRLPGRTSARLFFPVFAERIETYKVEVFCDGTKQPSNVYNDMTVRLLSYRDRLLSILNDSASLHLDWEPSRPEPDSSEDSPGALSQLPGMKGKYLSTLYSHAEAPVNRNFCSFHDAVLIYNPDFSQYSSAQLDAILSYAAEGGTVVFLHPEGVMAAAKTRLAEMLPVIPEQIVPVDGLNPNVLSKKFRRKPIQTEFLVSVPGERCAVKATFRGMPLLSECQFGFGYVRVLHFPLNDKTMEGAGEAHADIVQLLAAHPDMVEDRQAFEETLDRMTGFNIPDVSQIVVLLAVYLIGLLLILTAGRIFRRSCFAWVVATAFSAGMVFFVLRMADESFAGQKPVLAEITANLETPIPTNETFASCFMTEEETVNASLPGTESQISTIPYPFRIPLFYTQDLDDVDFEDFDAPNAKKKKKPESLRIPSLLDIHRGTDAETVLTGLTLAPRTSKQFMSRYISASPVVRKALSPEPELIFSDKDIEMSPYLPPEEMRGEKPESVWMILPGGVREVNKDDSGAYRLVRSSGVFQDEASRNLAETLRTGFAKQTPYLAFVYPVRENAFRLDRDIQAQGKRIVMIPLRITIRTRDVYIPGDCVVPESPGGIRPFLRGHRIMPKSSVMVGQPVSVRVSLPVMFHRIFHPETMLVSAEAKHSDEVSFLPTLGDASAAPPQKIRKGERKGSTCEYEFRGDLEPYVNNQSRIEINLETEFIPGLESSDPETLFTANTWKLQSFGVSFTGRVDDSIPLPVKF